MKKDTMTISYLLVIILSTSIVMGTAFAQTGDNTGRMFEQASIHFTKGEYREAVTIYDNILDISPDNILALKMKGIAQSNLEQHTQSLKQFFKVLQYNPNDVLALTGMGVGFGNLGEYKEAVTYFQRAINEEPDNVVVNNYKEFADKVIAKYPYTPTEKPEIPKKVYITTIPEWIKPIAKWWSEGDIADSEFISACSYLIENKIIQLPPVESQGTVDGKIPQWVKSNAALWADGAVDNDTFVSGIQHMIGSRLIAVDTQEAAEKLQKDLDQEFQFFERYLRNISNDVSKEKRYIEFPNPSKDVIKKFLRDYVKWNFENEVKSAAEGFPDPTYEIVDDTFIINYKVFINDQPTGLPLDHVSTLEDTFVFWEGKELSNNDDEKVKIKFIVTNLKHKANVWVTWVVRDLGGGALGHAHLGKGVVEVTLGDYRCDGSFQLYDVKSVQAIMTHELGHSIGLKHVTDRNNIMYPQYAPSYAYCLLN